MAKAMGRIRVPENVTFGHYNDMRRILEGVLKDIEGVVGDDPKWVSCRLNQTDVDTPKPFFLAWVGNYRLQRTRIGAKRQDPGLFRFLDDVKADTYTNTLTNPTRTNKQDWSKVSWKKTSQRQAQTPILEELHLFKDGGYFQLSIENFRLSVAIKAANRFVGALNTGLTNDPSDKLDKKLMYWAQDPQSELVQYVENTFDLTGAGPPV
jgi:hypothetical protein